MKVLIADDSTVVRERLSIMLSECKGVDVISQARDGAEAIDSISTLHPDVVVLDIRMPRKSGIDVLKEISRLSHAGDDGKAEYKPKIIVLTSYPYPQYRQKCMELGADFFFDKSQDFEKVPEVLKDVHRNAED